MKISDGAVKLLKEYASRKDSKEMQFDRFVGDFERGIIDGMTILAQEILKQLQESE